MNELTALVEQARGSQVAQRHEAFAQLVNRFQEAAYRWAYSILYDSHLAQDAVQEAFVTAYQNLGQLQHVDAFAAWFRQIVLSQSYRLVRGKQLVTSSIDDIPELPADEESMAAHLEALELHEKVMTAVQSLPEGEREITKMFYLGGYSQKEIARTLELPLTTVKKRLQYARQKLKLAMVAMFAPEPAPALVPVPVRVRPSHPHNPMTHDV